MATNFRDGITKLSMSNLNVTVSRLSVIDTTTSRPP